MRDGAHQVGRPITFGWALVLALLLWRVWSVPTESLWRDWLLLVTFAVAARVWKPASRFSSATTIFVAAFMLTVYVQGQLPHLLETLGLWR